MESEVPSNSEEAKRCSLGMRGPGSVKESNKVQAEYDV